MIQPNLFPEAGTPKGRFYVVAGLIFVIMSSVSIATFWFIFAATHPAPAAAPTNTIYVAYNQAPSNYIKPESLAAMQAYIKQYPQPQNVQILKGWTTQQISTYMVAQVAGGLKVDCSYCHNIKNFGQVEGYPNAGNKNTARKMMLMSADLNQHYITLLPASVGGYQITCATCHNGKPQFATYPIEIQNTLPNDYKLPFDKEYPGSLRVTGDVTKGNTEVERNQYAMYHMNVSLGQGCTFCHNARYFPSNEIPQKLYAGSMLQMSKHIYDTYVFPGGKASDGIMAGKTNSCWMCHRGARIPPGAAKPGTVPEVLSSNPPKTP